ncbi:DUF3823 domain-containing protein [Aliifodinibius sp. S!AR15-10]|uniref:DUF3823 domain-containing protein n=1 Tax=Aliifodinibius sp. S!AR15-10 TaxID=2950437 RepID=UPI002858B4A8|nr:DUF3823 domain-containing protein [Aliifodinibius sp. S!AR15-10]MDR8392950.1 DUF3823 domain-containing protein [Aliifodinibius sp. S!AR15-10]
MKFTTIISTIIFGAVLVTVAGCGLTEFDNYDKPKSTLTGAVVHDGDTLQLRSGAVELEIWEDGYTDYEKIPVEVGQDGTFSSSLFEGQYKMTQLVGDGPWVTNTDTTEFELSGSKDMQFEVEPFYKVASSDIRLDGSEIVADFTLEEVNDSRNITWVTLFIGTGRFTSIQQNSFFWNQISETGDPQNPYQIDENGANTYSPPLSALPEDLANREYVFARIAVEIDGKEDALYSKVHKIMLQ